MIRAALLLFVVACNDTPAKSTPAAAPTAAPSPGAAKPARQALVIEPAAAKLSGELWFTEGASPHRVMKLAGGKATEIGKGSAAVFGGLYPTQHRLKDGRVLAITSFGDGRPDGERLVLVTSNGSITTLGDPAMAVRDPTLSPDGSWIVSAVQTEGITNLVLLEIASGAQKALTTHREGNFTPVAISKDAIAFVSSRDGDSEIYRMNVDGTNVQRLTAFHREDYEPAIDASGKQLAFTSDREQKVPRIFVVVPDGTGVRRLTKNEDPSAEESMVVWSPKHTAHFAYTLKRDGHAKVVAVNGAVEKVLTPPNTNDSEVAFSPDGNWLVLVRERVPEKRGGASHASESHASASGASQSHASASGASYADASHASASGAAGESHAGASGAESGHAHDHAAVEAELVAYPLPAGSAEPIVIARGAIRTPRWF